MRRLSAVLVAAVLLGGPAVAGDRGDEQKGALGRANERATEATRGTAREVGRALERANEEATEATRGTAKAVGKAARDAADDLGKAFRDLGKRLSE